MIIIFFLSNSSKIKSIDDYIKNVISSDKSIINITFDKDKNILKYIIKEDSSLIENDFYGLAKTLEFDWTYYLYHDIYDASFYFKEVKSVTIYDASNEKYITFLPAKTDILLNAENNLLIRNVYVKDLDYNSLNIECLYSKERECILLNDSIYKHLKI